MNSKYLGIELSEFLTLSYIIFQSIFHLHILICQYTMYIHVILCGYIQVLACFAAHLADQIKRRVDPIRCN